MIADLFMDECAFSMSNGPCTFSGSKSIMHCAVLAKASHPLFDSPYCPHATTICSSCLQRGLASDRAKILLNHDKRVIGLADVISSGVFGYSPLSFFFACALIVPAVCHQIINFDL